MHNARHRPTCSPFFLSSLYHTPLSPLLLFLPGCNALVAVAYAIFELSKPKLLTATSVHEFMNILSNQLRNMTSAGPLLHAARRILISVGPGQLNEARRMVTMDVASDAEDMMKRKLHRKFSYFDDVAFGEACVGVPANSVTRIVTSGGQPGLSNSDWYI